jgi:atypical dual specificity phosphatase
MRSAAQDGPDERVAQLERENQALTAALEQARRRIDSFRAIFARVIQESPLAAELRGLPDEELLACGIGEDDVQLLRASLSPLQNFSWVLPGQLAGCAVPQTPHAVRALAEQGVRTVLSLTETPLPSGWLAQAGVTALHLPVPDFTSPTDRQLAQATEAIDASLAAGKPVAVHCLGGAGRTGTVLAAYLVHRGLAAQEAITEVRRLRPHPRSIETPEQEEAVRRFAERRA